MMVADLNESHFTVINVCQWCVRLMKCMEGDIMYECGVYVVINLTSGSCMYSRLPLSLRLPT